MQVFVPGIRTQIGSIIRRQRALLMSPIVVTQDDTSSPGSGFASCRNTFCGVCEYVVYIMICKPIQITATDLLTRIVNTMWRHCTVYHRFYIGFICNLLLVLNFLFFDLEQPNFA